MQIKTQRSQILMILLKLIKPLIKKVVMAKLREVATSEYIVNTINSKIDIPKLDEIQEKALINAIIVSLFVAVEQAIDKI